MLSLDLHSQPFACHMALGKHGLSLRASVSPFVIYFTNPPGLAMRNPSTLLGLNVGSEGRLFELSSAGLFALRPTHH